MSHFVYILKCNDGLFYCGITKNLDTRLQEHVSGQCLFTSKRRPVKLVWNEKFYFHAAARLMEEKIKKNGPRNFLHKKMKLTDY